MGETYKLADAIICQSQLAAKRRSKADTKKLRKAQQTNAKLRARLEEMQEAAGREGRQGE